VILNLTIYLGKAVLFPEEVNLMGLDILTLVWIGISFVALYKYQFNMIAWIGVSALFGLVRWLII